MTARPAGQQPPAEATDRLVGAPRGEFASVSTRQGTGTGRRLRYRTGGAGRDRIGGLCDQ